MRWRSNSSAHKLTEQLGEQLSASVITNAKWEDKPRRAVEAKDTKWIKENVDVSRVLFRTSILS
ncbi:hypothetical protein [Cohnella faecalis]|uniref:Uncharacterized protein n=1 Tax=Cohnella faecalis TaxID=2315694 RepID=A0A398D019_9BACL|nr:hypothetical protein [Cohnella faecalis]RIE04514.1 hypothetical protein D3H35_05780 [Cohnella faecalis]